MELRDKALIIIGVFCLVSLLTSINANDNSIDAKEISKHFGHVVEEINITNTDHVPMYVYDCVNGGFISFGYRGEGEFGERGECRVAMLALEDLTTLNETRLNTILVQVFGNETVGR